MKHFLISCGGTGGHLAPGIAIAQELIGRGHRCTLVISKKQVDARLLQHYPKLDFVSAPGAPFSLNPLRLLHFLITQMRLLAFSSRLLRRTHPDAIIAFGGFITAGIALAGFCHGYPLILHEANRKPGKAIRLLRGLADRVYLPEGVSLPHLPPKIARNFGYPLRREIRRLPKLEGREKTGVEGPGKLLVILGGSQGARVLNEWARENFSALAERGINLYCITGLGKGEDRTATFKRENGTTARAYFTPFTDAMGEVLSSADLVISRAGAGSIAELIHCRVPSLLVPYPWAVDNHQLANARYLEQQGGGIVIEEKDIGTLREEVLELISNEWLLGKLYQNLERLDRCNNTERIAGDLEGIAVEFQEAMKARRGNMEMPA